MHPLSKEERTTWSRDRKMGAGVMQAGVTIISLTVASRVMGLIREATIAGSFGAGSETDAFFIAFRIPDILFNSLISVAVGSAFIPVFSEYLSRRGEREAWQLAGKFLVLLLLVLLVFVLAATLFCFRIIEFMAPGLDREHTALAGNLARIMMPIVLFGGVAGVMKSSLNTMKHYFTPALIPVVYNVVIISTILLLSEKVGIYTLAYGTLLAAVAQVLIQAPSYVKRGGWIRFRIDYRDEGIRKITRLLPPVATGLTIGQLIPFVEIYLASQVAPGAISYLSYAYRIISLPEQMFTIVISTILFPMIALGLAENRKQTVLQELEKGIRLTLFLTIPLGLLFTGSGNEIVGLLLKRGAFGTAGVEGTSIALSVYALGLSSFCMVSLASLVLFAMKESKIIMISMIIFAFVHVSLDFLLVRSFSYVGIAVGSVVTSTLHAGYLLKVLERRGMIGSLYSIAGYALKIVLISSLVFGSISAMRLFVNFETFGRLEHVVQLPTTVVLSVLLYIPLSWVLRVSEVRILWEAVMWGRKR